MKFDKIKYYGLNQYRFKFKFYYFGNNYIEIKYYDYLDWYQYKYKSKYYYSSNCKEITQQKHIDYINHLNEIDENLKNRLIKNKLGTKYLCLGNCNLKEIPKVFNKTFKRNIFHNITYLSIYKNQIKQIENLPEKLKELDISANEIEKIENLPLSLICLRIENNKINKIENLPPNLEYLFIGNNYIKKIKNLSVNLKVLVIRNNNIKKLENLDNLYYLRIDDNYIKKIKKLPPKLEQLYIEYNKIEKINLTIKMYNIIRNLKKFNSYKMFKKKYKNFNEWFQKNGKKTILKNEKLYYILKLLYKN